MSDSSIEWAAIRRNWPIIITICACIGFGMNFWAAQQENTKDITELKNIVSLETIIAYEKRMMLLEHSCGGRQ